MTATVSIFRAAAIEARAHDAEAEPLDAATPWSWLVFAVCAVIFAVALILAAVLRVEVTGRARGALVPVGGVRAIDASASGIVAEVFHSRGDVVRAGEPLLRIESAETR